MVVIPLEKQDSLSSQPLGFAAEVEQETFSYSLASREQHPVTRGYVAF
jgi:hypothetical protein